VTFLLGDWLRLLTVGFHEVRMSVAAAGRAPVSSICGADAKTIKKNSKLNWDQ